MNAENLHLPTLSCALLIAAVAAACDPPPVLIFEPLPPDQTYPWVVADSAAAAHAAARRSTGAAVRIGQAHLRVLEDAARCPEPVVCPRCPASDRRSSRPTSPVDVNGASADALETLPRVGPAMAERIISGRPYASVDELTRVSGIGPATLEQLRPYVRVE